MRRTMRPWLLAIAISRTILAQAAPPTSPQPDAPLLLKTLGPQSNAPLAGPGQVDTDQPRRRLFGALRPDRVAEAKPKPKPSGVVPPKARVAGSVGVAPRSSPVAPDAKRPAADAPVRRAQAMPGELGMPTPMAAPLTPEASPPAIPTVASGGQSISLEAALYGAITSNPDVVALRQNNVASPEAVEVARRFPVALNPTLWVDVRPFITERVPGGIGPSGRYHGPSLDHKDTLMYFSLRQPIELGHQTTHRYNIAKAAYSQQQWNVVQAELLALVQTYRFYQTAAYRREKLRLAGELADFNERTLATLRGRQEANVALAADVALASVESEATRQLVEAAQQDYLTALTDLRNQIGRPEEAGSAEPLGEFILPGYIPEIEDKALIDLALQSRPEIRSAQAGVAGAKAALCLAEADRRHSTPVVGPVYERDEQGSQFFGFVYITPLRVLNNGQPLVNQRQADLQRSATALENAHRRVASQVTAAVAKWNGANSLVAKTAGLTERLATQVGTIERLFEAGQTDFTKLLQARQRLIQLRNSQLDATWQATQAQADLLSALGAPTLIASLQGGNASPSAMPPPPTPAAGAPFRQ